MQYMTEVCTAELQREAHDVLQDKWLTSRTLIWLLLLHCVSGIGHCSRSCTYITLKPSTVIINHCDSEKPMTHSTQCLKKVTPKYELL